MKEKQTSIYLESGRKRYIPDPDSDHLLIDTETGHFVEREQIDQKSGISISTPAGVALGALAQVGNRLGLIPEQTLEWVEEILLDLQTAFLQLYESGLLAPEELSAELPNRACNPDVGETRKDTSDVLGNRQMFHKMSQKKIVEVTPWLEAMLTALDLALTSFHQISIDGKKLAEFWDVLSMLPDSWNVNTPDPQALVEDYRKTVRETVDNRWELFRLKNLAGSWQGRCLAAEKQLTLLRRRLERAEENEARLGAIVRDFRQKTTKGHPVHEGDRDVKPQRNQHEIDSKGNRRQNRDTKELARRVDQVIRRSMGVNPKKTIPSKVLKRPRRSLPIVIELEEKEDPRTSGPWQALEKLRKQRLSKTSLDSRSRDERIFYDSQENPEINQTPK